MPQKTKHSGVYADDRFEYRHVILCDAAFREMPKGRLLREEEWQRLGVFLEGGGSGWEHYAIHRPEPFVLLFRRPLVAHA